MPKSKEIQPLVVDKEVIFRGRYEMGISNVRYTFDVKELTKLWEYKNTPSIPGHYKAYLDNLFENLLEMPEENEKFLVRHPMTDHKYEVFGSILEAAHIHVNEHETPEYAP